MQIDAIVKQETVIHRAAFSDGMTVEVFCRRPLREALQGFADSLARSVALGQVYDTTKAVGNG